MRWHGEGRAGKREALPLDNMRDNSEMDNMRDNSEMGILGESTIK